MTIRPHEVDPNAAATRILVIVVNYRTGPLVIDCLRSLHPQIQSLRSTHVTIADNASSDGSVEEIRTAIEHDGFGNWANMMELEHNGGYAYANNAVIRSALEHRPGPDYFLLLNPDTLVRPGALPALLEFMETHRQVGIAGSQLEHLDGTPQDTARRFPSVLSELEEAMRLGFMTRLLAQRVVAPPTRHHAHQTDWIPGASMMIRREVFDAVGLFDEGYFLYFEEVDFCLQARRAGWPCWYVPDSRVVHLIGQATKIRHDMVKPGRRPTYWFESRRRYFVKCHGRCKAVLADLARVFGWITWRVRRLLQRKPDMDPPMFLTDLVRQSVLLKGFKL